MWVALTRAICRIERLRKKMKESQDYMAELDKHLYVVLERGQDLRGRCLLMGSCVGRNMRRARVASRIDRFFGSSMDAGFVVVTSRQALFSFRCAYPKSVFLRLQYFKDPSQPRVKSLLSTSGTPDYCAWYYIR